MSDGQKARSSSEPLLVTLCLLLAAACVLILCLRWNRSNITTVEARGLGSPSDKTPCVASNGVPQGQLSDYEARLRAADQLIASLRSQLDSTAAQLSNALQVANATAGQVRPMKASRALLQALREFHSTSASPASYEEYQLGLRKLKTVLDENRPAIPEGEFKAAVEEAFHDFKDAFDLWCVALQKSQTEFRPILEKRGWWHGKKGDFRFDKFVKANGREPTETELRSLNTPVPGYTLEYSLQKIIEEAGAEIDLAERKLQ